MGKLLIPTFACPSSNLPCWGRGQLRVGYRRWRCSYDPGLMAGPGYPAHCYAPFNSTNTDRYLLCARQPQATTGGRRNRGCACPPGAPSPAQKGPSQTPACLNPQSLHAPVNPTLTSSPKGKSLKELPRALNKIGSVLFLKANYFIK